MTRGQGKSWVAHADGPGISGAVGSSDAGARQAASEARSRSAASLDSACPSS